MNSRYFTLVGFASIIVYYKYIRKGFMLAPSQRSLMSRMNALVYGGSVSVQKRALHQEIKAR